jgi:dolichyl-phosphate-mannose-protein mannosyltransferase
MQNLLLKHKVLLLILVFTAFTHLFRFDYPDAYVFDEVYHGFTAKEYAKNEAKAWEWWNAPPPGVAYEWTHPPLAKEIMSLSLKLFNTEQPWGWRLPGIILGVVSTLLVYLLAKKLTQNEKVGLLSSFVYSLNGLLLVQARTGMNDIYVVTFMLASLLLLLHKRLLFSAIFLGLALASKWSALYLYGVILIVIIFQDEFPNSPQKIIQKLKVFAYFVTIPPIIYLLSYTPFFLYDHQYNEPIKRNNIDLFIELQQQMWWYHSGLKATHDYASPWWSWPFNFFPVWYYVEYPAGKIANILPPVTQ